jgi:acyl carrier protein
MNIKTWLINWFAENTTESASAISVSTDESYFDKGLIDSIKFISLLDDIEDEFGIVFDNDAFIDRRFATIDGLAEIIDVIKGA